MPHFPRNQRRQTSRILTDKLIFSHANYADKLTSDSPPFWSWKACARPNPIVLNVFTIRRRTLNAGGLLHILLNINRYATAWLRKGRLQSPAERYSDMLRIRPMGYCIDEALAV